MSRRSGDLVGFAGHGQHASTPSTHYALGNIAKDPWLCVVFASGLTRDCEYCEHGRSNVSSVVKMFSGARLRRLREERGLTQAALARALDLSTSYVNQLENNQRPLTVPVLLALTDVFTATEHAVSRNQIEELVARMPEIGRSLVALHRRLRDVTEEVEAYRSRAIAETSQPLECPMPFEEVRDFFYDRNNYIDELDVAAERMFAENELRTGGLDLQLAALIRERFGITVVIDTALPETTKRQYDPTTRVLRVAHWLRPGQRAFQIATQLALLSQSELF